MAKLNVGDRVQGKTKKLRDRQGIIVSIRKEAKQHSYGVVWDGGSEECVAARSITAVPSMCVQGSQHVSFVELLQNVQEHEEEASVCESFESSNSDGDDEDSFVFVDASNSELQKDDGIQCGDRVWLPCDHILTDPRGNISRRHSILHWPESLELGEKTHVKYFYLMYPMSTLETTLTSTTKVLQLENRAPLTTAEYFRWIGIRLAMTIDGSPGSYRRNWEKEVADGCIDTPRDYGNRYHMSVSRFEQILNALKFHDDGNGTDEADPWSAIRPLINEFNRRRQQVISPGDMLVVDECMVGWEGISQDHHHLGIPHKTKIPRKPGSQGAELKSMVDGILG